MIDSILNTVKKKCQIPIDCDDFDDDLLVEINSVFMTAMQIGFSDTAIVVNDDTKKWSDLGLSEDKLGFIKSYVCNKTKLKFDPPQNSTLLNSLQETIRELESRINYETTN